MGQSREYEFSDVPEIDAEDLVIDVITEERVRVVHGPACWVGKTGSVLEQRGDMVRVSLFGTDDAKGEPREFTVNMPWAMVQPLVVKA